MQTQLIIDNESREAHDGRTFERRNPLTETSSPRARQRA